ncbi:MAG: hypothetical protein ACOVNL_08655 [Prochlorococcaceae cyanobacterium]|jgi:hypothetical protein
MPISLRLSLLFALATILGCSLIVTANFVKNWNVIGSFARGFIPAALGLAILWGWS